MDRKSYIVVGAKGTSINELSRIEPPLSEGENRIPKNIGQGYSHLEKRAHSWISKRGTAFSLFKLNKALRRGLVRRFSNAQWVIEGKRFTGDAYFKSTWVPGDEMPQYVAVVGKDYIKGRVERWSNKGNRGHGVVGEFIESSLIPPNIVAKQTGKDSERFAVPLDVRAFDPARVNAGKESQLRLITLRRGQPEFRKNLLKIYGESCCISGETCVEVLEAAHIIPYDGEGTNHPENGLLLRSDLHTLFDLNLLSVDPASYRITLASSLKGSSYWSWHGKAIVLPQSHKPQRDALRRHFKQLKP